MKGSAPAAPNPYTSAQAQYTYGTQAAQYGAGLNDVNTVSPTGSTSYAFGENPQTGMPTTTQTTNLSPAEQSLLTGSQGIQQGQLGTAGTLAGSANAAAGAGEPNIAPVQYSAGNAGPVATSINTSGVPGIGPTQGYEQYGQKTALAGEEAAMQPGMQQQYEQLDASLRNSGATPGSPAYDNAMSAFDANMNNAQTQAAGAAINAGTGLQNTQYGESANTNQQLFTEAQAQEAAQNQGQSQQFGENLNNAQLSNSAGTTALSDWANELGIPENEISSILGGTQVASPSSIAPTSSQISAPDIMSAFQNQYAGQLAGYNANVASTNGLIGDASTLGALAIMASDPRVKKDISAPIGETAAGIPIHRFRYLWD